MERFKTLDYRQKWIFLIMGVMVLVFTILYPVTLSRVGYSYRDAILVPHEAEGTTVYSGKIQGEAASFTVTQDKTVTFQYGDFTYGPYTVKEDPQAAPESGDLADSLSGVEIWRQDSRLFRGGVQKLEQNGWLLYNENGTLHNIETEIIFSGNNPAEQMEPSLATILDLAMGPELTHKGHWLPWFLGILLCVVNAVSILYADELFRFWLSFRIESPELAEPTDLEITGRYFGWGAMLIGIFVVFIIGLS